LKKSNLEYIIPAALALVITIGLILFIPILTQSHLLKLEKHERVQGEDYRYYFDLNGDGDSECIFVYINASNNVSFSIGNSQEATFNQFNLPGKLTRMGATLDLHDINQDGIVDIFACTEKNDSLFLTIIDDLYGHPTTTTEYFLDRINQYNDHGDYLFVPGEATDLNGDGSPEYLFAINGGHSLQPRCVYAVDYKNDSVIRSPMSGAAIVGVDCFDLDQDGRDEILLNTVAPENYKSHVPYRDSVSWIMVLDENLNFYKSPVEKYKAPSNIDMVPIIYQGEHYLMTYHRYRIETGFNAELAIYDDSLQLVKDRIIRWPHETRFDLWNLPGGTDLCDVRLSRGDRVYTFDWELNINDSIIFRKQPFSHYDVYLDADADGVKEYVYFTSNGLNISRSDLQHIVSLDISNTERNPRILISMVERIGSYPTLFVQIGSNQYFVNYLINPWFKYREVVYPGIMIVLFGLFYVWVMLQSKIISRRYEKERLISKLQLLSIKNQLDPHFTFNALNAVGSLIYKGDKEYAYQYLKGLTDLLRMVSGDAGEVTWTLSDELEFVIKYVEIEKLRFRENFNYRLDIADNRLKEFQVPKMSILTFVENSIKHGLRHKMEDRNIEIRVSNLGKGMRIEIQDNGIGRAASAQHRVEPAGNGIEIMHQYFKQFQITTGKEARFEVRDLFDDELRSSGTLVEISIQ